jgi:ankyrin repeat protein
MVLALLKMTSLTSATGETIKKHALRCDEDSLKNQMNKRRRVSSTIDDDNDLSPSDYMASTLQANGFRTSVEQFSVEDALYFLPYLEGEIAVAVLRAVRQSDLTKLREFAQQEEKPLHQRNAFGESLLHLVCRWAMVDVAKFLIEEAQLPLNVRDSFGRTPMHNVCVAYRPNYTLMGLLLAKSPELLLFSDYSGCLPCDYIRPSSYSGCTEFLSKNVSWILSFDRKYQESSSKAFETTDLKLL